MIPSADSENTLTHSRDYYGKLAGWASILTNLFLFVIKAVLGFMSGSLALIADAFHTLSDIGTSIIVLISFFITAKPSDAEHPFGHQRAEYISAIIMATILAVTGLELLKSAIDRLLHPVPFSAPLWLIGVLIGTILVKEGLFFLSRHYARMINSSALEADAWHHHQDAISTMMVVAAFGASRLGFPYLDAPVGILIALYILYTAFQIAKKPVDQLLGLAPSDKFLNDIEEIVLSFREVRGVHDIIVHQYGENSIFSLHIEVDENLTLNEAHNISEAVNAELRDRLKAYVTIHVDPVMKRTPRYRAIESSIRQFCESNPNCETFHDLRIAGDDQHLHLYFDLVLSSHASKGSELELEEACRQYLQKKYPRLTYMTTKVEPRFSISRKSRHDAVH